MQNNSGNFLCNGELEIVKITEELYDQAIQLYQKYFMKYENISIAANLLGSQQTIDEMELLIRAILKDGISFAAQQVETKELVAMCCNKILNPSAKLTLDDVMAGFSTPSMKFVVELLDRMENTYDLYKEWNIDCVMEIVFLSTRTDYACRGLGAALSQFSIDYARRMKHKNLSPNDQLPAHVAEEKPQAVCAVFTSRFSQKVGEKLGFKTVYEVPNTEFAFEGKTLAQKIDPMHVYSTFAALLL